MNSQNRRWSGNIKVNLLPNTHLFTASIFYQLKNVSEDRLLDFWLFYSQLSFISMFLLFFFSSEKHFESSVRVQVLSVSGVTCCPALWTETKVDKNIKKDQLHWTNLSGCKDTGSFSCHALNIYYHEPNCLVSVHVVKYNITRLEEHLSNSMSLQSYSVEIMFSIQLTAVSLRVH